MIPVEEFLEWDDNSLEALLVALLGSCSLALNEVVQMTGTDFGRRSMILLGQG